MYDVKMIAGKWRVRALSVCFGPMIISQTFATQAKAWDFIRSEMCVKELTRAEVCEEVEKWKTAVNWHA